MGIKYLIFQTHLQGESKFFGRVILKGTLNQGAMIDRVLDMGTSLTKPDITAVLNLLSMGIAKACNEGYKVNLDGLFQVSRSLNERLVKDASVERVIENETRPILLDVVDSNRPQEYLRLVNAQNPTEFFPVSRFHKVTDQEFVFRLPQVSFAEGYFELATSLNTQSIRIGRSVNFQIAA